MLIKIFIGLAVIVVVFLVAAALQPSDLRVERSIVVSAPAALAFGQLNDLHKWEAMSPYVRYDPAAKYTFDGPATGVGATVAWAGNSKVGVGRMTIVDSRPNEFIRMKLEFLKPFACTNTAEFTFRAAGSETKVTWAMYGENKFIGKAMGLVMDMDKMIGSDFEVGLTNLKNLVETAARK